MLNRNKFNYIDEGFKMSLFDNVNDIYEDIEDIVSKLINAEIFFEDNSYNNKRCGIGRYTLLDGLFQLYEPDNEIDDYMIICDTEIVDIELFVDRLKEEELTIEQLNLLRTIVNDNFYDINDEFITKNLINYFRG